MASWAAAWPQKSLGEKMSAAMSAGLDAALGGAWNGKLNAKLHAALNRTARSTCPGSTSHGSTWQNAAPAAPRRCMPGAPEIYFRKAIDNSRLVRAVDSKVKREIHLFTATVVVCCLMALVYLGQHCSSIEYGYKIEDLRAKRDQAVQVNRTLRLEEATLKDPERINALASNLGLALPAVGQVQHMDDGDARDSGAPIIARADSILAISVPN